MKYENITKLRVYATMLVVVGHALIIYDPTWGVFKTVNTSIVLYNLKKFINLFQMPIFMFISGYLYFESSKKEKYKNFKIFIKEKFIRLIIPFVCVAMFWMVPIRIFIKLKGTIENGYLELVLDAIIGRSSGHLWFLPTLFIIFILIHLLNNSNIKDRYLVLLFLIMNFISYFMPEIFFIANVSKYCIYFYFGFTIAKYKINIDKMNKFTVYVCFIITSILIIFVINNMLANIILNFIVALLGILASNLICNTIKANKFVNYIDRTSFAIYLLHTPIMYIIFNYFNNTYPIILIISNVILGITVSIVIANILKRIKLDFIIGN